ncbi:hypothetical protein ACIPLR_06010 [Herbaspirillum huttiense]|uniref:hypothetical protein n=1 Tax=Herbaspirillum huttiense TaxID=863372 RepID=UPI0037FD19AC
MNKTRIYLALVVLSMLLLAVVQLVQFAKRWTQPVVEESAPAHLTTPFPYVEGHLSGVQVRVPANFMRGGRPYMVQYEDDSPWAPKESEGPEEPRTLASPIISLTFHVRLPDVEPLTEENFKSWNFALWNRTSEKSEWIDFSFKGNSPALESWGIHSILNGHLVNRKYRLAKGIEFKTQDQEVFGLQMEKTFPVDESTYDRNNYHYYFRRVNSQIATFIECRAGKTPVPNGEFYCEHYFSMWPDAVVEGYITYRSSRLGEWEMLEDKAKKLFLRFVVGCVAFAPACPDEHS